MKKQIALKTALCGISFYSALLVGEQAMAADKVVVVPMSSGKVFTFGKNNLFAGDGAGNHTMTGRDNTGVGYGVLAPNTTGDENTGVGSKALTTNTTGYYNTAIGSAALTNNTNGSNNTAVGQNALPNNTNGQSNTAIGTGAMANNSTGGNNTATGQYALFYNKSSYYNTANGMYALAYTEGGYNTAIGVNAGETNTTGTNNTFVGYEADASLGSLINATAIGNGAKVTASNRVRIGNDNVTHIQGKVAFTTTSDKRQKKDIQDISKGLEFIKALRPVEYRMIRKEGEDRLNFGFIAQDIEALLGDKYNILDIAPDKDRSLSLRYTDFIAPMVKAMQEQQAQIQEQLSINAKQQVQITTQIEVITAMRAELNQVLAEIKALKTSK